MKVLFEQKGIWEEFKHLHWKEGNEKGGQKNLDLCKKAADAYDALLKVPPSEDTGLPEEAVIQVRLPRGELEKLREKAKRLLGSDDPSTLARIWILGWLL